MEKHFYHLHLVLSSLGLALTQLKSCTEHAMLASFKERTHGMLASRVNFEYALHSSGHVVPRPPTAWEQGYTMVQGITPLPT